MGVLTWDQVGDRTYEGGVDRGVLYLPDGSAVPWNGLTAITEKSGHSVSSVYFDGMKISDLVSVGNFSASMKALTYPDEFEKVEGYGEGRRGMLFGDQMPQTFGLCYRTQIGNDIEGSDAGYKLHILYNVTAMPGDKAFSTLTAEASLTEFEWDILAIPEEVPGVRPTAHIVIKSTEFDPYLLQELEDKLYGSGVNDAVLLPMSDLVAFITEWYRIKIVDNLDGTWTAICARPEFVYFEGLNDSIFTLLGVNAVFLVPGEIVVISDTYDLYDVPKIEVIDNGDGTWSATTTHEDLFSVDVNQEFEIRNANAIFLSGELYRFSSTSGS